MGLTNRFPGQLIPVVSEDILADGMVVRLGAADNKVRLPSGSAPTTPLCGVCYRPDGSSCAAGDTIDLAVSGIVAVRISGTVTRGDLLTSGGTDGACITETAGAGVNVGIIGQAMQSGVTGDRISVLLSPNLVKQGG